MNFNLSSEYLEGLHSAIEHQDQTNLYNFIKELHPVDLAEVINELNREDSVYLFKNLKPEIASLVLSELDESIRGSLLQNLQPSEIADLLDCLSSDDVTDIVNELPDEIKTEVVRCIDDKQQAKDVTELLHYEQDTAGGLMAKELIKARHNWTVEQCIQEIKSQYGNVEKIYWVYVVDEFDKLIGLLSLEKLIVSDNQIKLVSICDKNFVFVNPFTKQQEVADLMEKYDVVALPVLSNTGKLMGRITIDDVVDVIIEESEKDVQIMSGISENVEIKSSVWELTRSRLPWLLVGLVGGVIGVRFLSYFETDFRINPQIAFFIPLVLAMGGHAGLQSSTLIVQELASSNDLYFRTLFPRLGKIFFASLLNGLICSICLMGIEYLLSSAFAVTIIASVSLVTVIVFASIWGTFVPLFLSHFKINPAVASGPFISMFNDLLGLVVYFSIVQLF